MPSCLRGGYIHHCLLRRLQEPQPCAQLHQVLLKPLQFHPVLFCHGRSKVHHPLCCRNRSSQDTSYPGFLLPSDISQSRRQFTQALLTEEDVAVAPSWSVQVVLPPSIITNSEVFCR